MTTSEIVPYGSGEIGEAEVVDGQEPFDDTGHRPEDARGQFQFAELAGATPQVSTFSFSGELASLERELDMRERVVVTMADESGEVIAQALGFVRSVAATDSDSGTERVHKIKLGG